MKHRRGFLMIELMFTLMLLGIFALVATQLFHASFHVLSGSGLEGEAATRFDLAANMLRVDVAMSASSNMSDSQTLVLHESDGSEVKWSVNGKTTLLRQSSGQQRVWDIDQPIVIHKDGTVTLMGTANDVAGQVAMVSAGGDK